MGPGHDIANFHPDRGPGTYNVQDDFMGKTHPIYSQAYTLGSITTGHAKTHVERFGPLYPSYEVEAPKEGAKFPSRSSAIRGNPKSDMENRKKTYLNFTAYSP